jgi:hypothetical protein
MTGNTNSLNKINQCFASSKIWRSKPLTKPRNHELARGRDATFAYSSSALTTTPLAWRSQVSAVVQQVKLSFSYSEVGP